MHKALALGALLGLVVAVGAPGPALAAPTPRTTLKLSCDRGVPNLEKSGSTHIGVPYVLRA